MITLQSLSPIGAVAQNIFKEVCKSKTVILLTAITASGSGINRYQKMRPTKGDNLAKFQPDRPSGSKYFHKSMGGEVR